MASNKQNPNTGIGIVGCYTLDLYCACYEGEAFGRGLGEFTGRTEAECIRAARAAGWSVNKRANRARCPRCKK
jgi:hypothetical protein